MVVMEGRVSSAANDDGEFKHLAVSAVSEAFNNVVLHAYAERRGEIAIEIEPTPRALVVRLIDDGDSFDPAVVPLPELESLPEGGMGLYIMREAMDEIVYEAGPPNVLCLTKLRAVAAPDGDEEAPSGDRLALLEVANGGVTGTATERISGTRSAPPSAPQVTPTRGARASAKSGFRSKTVPPPAQTAADPRRA